MIQQFSEYIKAAQKSLGSKGSGKYNSVNL